MQLSIFYSRIVYSRFVFTARPYISLMAYSLILLLLNNAMAYLLSVVTGWLFEMDNLPFLQVQHIYVYAILSTFISSVYTNAHYLYAYITAEDEKKRLEILAMQAKLNALKQQIDPHFMFNNFSILSELIVEDRRLAVKFLDKLSKVYRYVIQNYDRDTVSVADELAFLDSYLYLMEMRYEGAVAAAARTARHCATPRPMSVRHAPLRLLPGRRTPASVSFTARRSYRSLNSTPRTTPCSPPKHSWRRPRRRKSAHATTCHTPS